MFFIQPTALFIASSKKGIPLTGGDTDNSPLKFEIAEI